MNLRQIWRIREMLRMLAISLFLVAGLTAGLAQSSPPDQSPSSAQPQSSSQNPSGSQPPARSQSQADNPFPGDGDKTGTDPSGNKAQQSGQKTAEGSDQKPKAVSDNPFPGEDPNAPIIPVEPTPGPAPRTGANPGMNKNSAAENDQTPRRDADPGGDPVRSPDATDNVVNDDGFSSSRSGLNQVPVEDESDGRPGKSTKNKTKEQLVKEDLDVGGYYLDRKNWKAAQSRFTSAFSIDSENPEAVWGLAEAERHLQLYKEAAEHYRLFLSYDPDGPHHREARKALEEVQVAAPNGSTLK